MNTVYPTLEFFRLVSHPYSLVLAFTYVRQDGQSTRISASGFREGSRLLSMIARLDYQPCIDADIMAITVFA